MTLYAFRTFPKHFYEKHVPLPCLHVMSWTDSGEGVPSLSTLRDETVLRMGMEDNDSVRQWCAGGKGRRRHGMTKEGHLVGVLFDVED